MDFTFWTFLFFSILYNFWCSLFSSRTSFHLFSSLHKTDALIFRHKAYCLMKVEKKRRKQQESRLVSLSYQEIWSIIWVASRKGWSRSSIINFLLLFVILQVRLDSWKRTLCLLFLFLSLKVFQMLHKVPENLNGTKLHYIF